jgi:Domain of unknown function (DUF5658)
LKYLFALLLLCATLHAENFVSAAASGPVADAPSTERPFWTMHNKVGFGILAGLTAADAITTQRGLSEGMRETNPLMRPFVTRGAAGEAVGSALGFSAAIGAAYVLHRSHHYKAERITMGLMLSGESAVVAHNIAVIH